MRRFLLLLSACLTAWLPLAAQSNQLIRELESKHSQLQKQIAETETLLKSAKRDAVSQLHNLTTLTGQIEERQRYIAAIEHDVEAIEKEVRSLDSQLDKLQKSLQEKKDRYAASVRYLYRNKSVEEKLMFIFSAQSLNQMYRRMRYVQEYATYQRLQGKEIVKQQTQIRHTKMERLQAKAAKQSLMAEREKEKEKLERQEKEQKVLVASLQNKQKSLQRAVDRKRQEADRLNAQIDKLIAEEIERARKQAQKETQQADARGKEEGDAPMEAYALSKADQKLSGNFTSNKGKLPMPITGGYIITSHYGQYSVKGLRNVKLDNKGIDIQGSPGAKARAIFDGTVAAVFQLNGLFNILIRHGNYISVYCNLSAADVRQGDSVKTKQPIGQVFSDPADGNRTVLHFQLRREKEKLNPEPWLNH